MTKVRVDINELSDTVLELLQNYFLDIGAPSLSSNIVSCYQDGDIVTIEVCVSGCIYRLEIAEKSGVRDLDGLCEFFRQRDLRGSFSSFYL